MSTIGGPNIVEDGLVFAVDAANKKSYPGSGTTWKDLSGNGNDGTLTNGPTFDSGNGGSIVFDGSDDRVDFSSITLENEWTICYWFYHDGSGDNMTLGQRNTSNNRFYHRDITGYKLRVHNNANTYTDMSIGDDKRNTWAFLTYGLSNTLQYGWVNGEQKVYGPYGGDPTFIFDCIGFAYSSGFIWSGKLNPCFIYNKTLTSTEVLQNYNALKSRFGL